MAIANVSFLKLLADKIKNIFEDNFLRGFLI